MQTASSLSVEDTNGLVYSLPDLQDSNAFIQFTLSGSHIVDGNTVEAKLYMWPGMGQAMQLVQTKSFTISGSVGNSVDYTWSGFSPGTDERHLIFANSSSVDDNSANHAYLETVVTDGSSETSVGYMIGYSFGDFGQPTGSELANNLDFFAATTNGLALHKPRTWTAFETSDGLVSLSVGQTTNHSASWGDEFDITVGQQATSGSTQNTIEMFIESSSGVRTYLELAFFSASPIWGATVPFSANHQLFFRLPVSGTNGTYDFGYRIKHADSTAEAATLFNIQFDIT